MDNEAPADASSSQSASVTLRSFGIERKDERAGDTVYRIRLSTGSSFFIPGRYLGSLVDELGGKPEDVPISGPALDALRFALESYNAEIKAVAFLARREHTESQLRIKLLKREFSKEAINASFAVIKELGWLSDERFAAEWVRSRIAREGRSVRFLYADLMKRGVSSELAENILRDLIPPETEYENLLRMAKKLSRSRSMDKELLFRKLGARGFDLSEIKKAISELENNGHI
jgi:regulatory protein